MIDKNEASEGYIAVRPGTCEECDLNWDMCVWPACTSYERRDNSVVIFKRIKKDG